MSRLPPEARKYLAKIGAKGGAKGGKTTGKSKVRGDAEYYRTIGQKSARNSEAIQLLKEAWLYLRTVPRVEPPIGIKIGEFLGPLVSDFGPEFRAETNAKTDATHQLQQEINAKSLLRDIYSYAEDQGMETLMDMIDEARATDSAGAKRK